MAIDVNSCQERRWYLEVEVGTQGVRLKGFAMFLRCLFGSGRDSAMDLHAQRRFRLSVLSKNQSRDSPALIHLK